MTTNAEWVTAFQSMIVTGVKRHYDAPPQQVGTADMPAAFLMLAGAGRGAPFTTCVVNSKVRSMQYMIATNPVGQDGNEPNYNDFAALADALETQLDALTVTEFIEYDIAQSATINIGGTNHWGLVANVTGRDAYG